MTVAPARVFVTGASGCVGQYVVDRFLADERWRVVALVRDAAKAPARWKGHERLSLLVADMSDTAAIAPSLQEVDVAVLLAAGWGGPAAFAVNLDANVALTQELVARGCRRILYFATASVLAPDGGVLEEAERLGTEYIRSKFALVRAMETQFAEQRPIGVFPTLVVGGDGVRPDSHVARLLRQAAPWAWLAAQFQVFGRFHFIHAEDIARIVHRLAEAGDEAPRRLVLGAPAVSVSEMIAVLARAARVRAYLRIPITPFVARALIALFRIQLSPWDQYCAQHPDQSYQAAVDPSCFGMATFCPDFATALASIGVGAPST